MEYIVDNFVMFDYTSKNGEVSTRQGIIKDVYPNRIRVQHTDQQNGTIYYRMYSIDRIDNEDTWNPATLEVVL
jgi:hypothetical protein